jgi:CDP-glucose 4,6-dehydratase
LLLTGHTGFKGTWMTFLLEHLNVPVVGYSLPGVKDSLYDRAERTGAIPEALEDIRDYAALEKFIDLHKPSTIIHMAAQPLVLKSYENPRETFDVNVMGTVNVLDIAFKKDFVKTIIVVTTDKVYRNDNSGHPFVETDPLEGKDPYSASKVGTESVVAAWQQISKISGGPRIISVRAGNVIGGGDWAENRIIPDLIRGIQSNRVVQVRNPESSRPWQHVLDPLFGYLSILTKIDDFPNITSLNFGPQQRSLSVGKLVSIAKKTFPELVVNLSKSEAIKDENEAQYLALDSTLAFATIGWRTVFDQETSIIQTLKWWKLILKDNQKAEKLCRNEIEDCIKNNTI